MKLRPGDIVELTGLRTVEGEPVRLRHPDPARLTHLQFRRFAACPICNLHLQSVVARHAEITASSIHEVVVFHSTPEELRTYTGDLPFDVVADPDKKLYKKFGVEASLRAVLDPRATAPLLRNMLRRSVEPARSSAGTLAHPTGGRLGLPADLLINADGKVLASKYGTHAYDQWSVDELLQLAAPSG